MSSNFTDSAQGVSSSAIKADSFVADTNVLGETMSYPTGFPVYPHAHGNLPPPPPAPPMFYSNPLNPATSLAAAISSYPVADVSSVRAIIPPPPDLKPICDKLAEYVARNGKQFEAEYTGEKWPQVRFKAILQFATADLNSLFAGAENEAVFKHC